MSRFAQPVAGGASLYVRPNDVGIGGGDNLERGYGGGGGSSSIADAPYPIQSKVPQRRCFFLAAASAYVDPARRFPCPEA